MTVGTTEKLDKAIKQGKALWHKDDFEGMLNHYQSVSVFFEDCEPKFRRFYLCNLAVAFQELGDNERAQAIYTDALKVEGQENYSDIATINANIAQVMLSLGQPDEALIYLSQPEDYHRSLNPKNLEDKQEWAFRLGNALETKARALRALGDKRSVDTANLAWRILRRFCPETKSTERAFLTMVMCWQER